MGSFVHKFVGSIKSNSWEGRRETGIGDGWRRLLVDVEATIPWLFLLGPGAWATLQRHPLLFTEAGTQILCTCTEQSGFPLCDCPHRQYLTGPAGY